MNKTVSWVFELTLTKGTKEDLLKLMPELIESAEKNEPNTLAYEWTFNDEKKACHIHETYADSEAALAHLKTFTDKFAGRLMSLGEATRFVVYGNPSHELKTALAGFGGMYMTPIGGFVR